VIPINADVLLAVALVAVYLIDSMQFLSIGDAVVTTRGGKPAGLSFGAAFELGGRRPFIANPLTPFRPNLRVEWDTSGAPVSAPAEVAQAFEQLLKPLHALGPFMAVSAVLVVLIAPVALASGYQVVFLGAVAFAWVLIAVACVMVILRRKALALTAGQTASIVFVALICLPCGPNLMRAIAKRQQWRLNARDLPDLGFDPTQTANVRVQVLGALTNAQRFVNDDGKERAVIDEQLRALAEPAP
jgi:hypothetical protein